MAWFDIVGGLAGGLQKGLGQLQEAQQAAKVEQRQQDLEQLSNFSDRFTDSLEFLSQLSLLSGVDTDNKPDQRNRAKARTSSSVAFSATQANAVWAGSS